MPNRTPAERASLAMLYFVATFFAVAAAFALLIAFTLFVPGTGLDGVWAMKPGSREGFAAIGILAPLLMLLLAAVLIFTSVALFRRRRWARWLAFALLVINVIPDAIQGILGQPTIFIPISIVAAVAVWLALPVTGRATMVR